jgi:hypothetical protein
VQRDNGPQPPERYKSPAWASHEEGEDPDEREAAAQAAWEAEEATAQVEEVLNGVVEEAPLSI